MRCAVARQCTRHWDVVRWRSVPQVREQGDELGPPAGAPALDRAGRDAEQLGGLVDGVALDVDEDQGGSLLVRQRAERAVDLPGELAASEWVARLDRVCAVVLGQRALSDGPCARRIRSRQALTTMRCSQVVTWASPRKDAADAVGLEQRVLQRVGGLVGVAGGAERDGPQPVTVAVAPASRTPTGRRRRGPPAARRPVAGRPWSRGKRIHPRRGRVGAVPQGVRRGPVPRRHRLGSRPRRRAAR